MWILPCEHTNTQTGQLLKNVADKDMTDTFVKLCVWKNVKSTQVEYSGLNNYLFHFCMPKSIGSSKTFMHEHVDGWVCPVLSLLLCTGDTQARTHAKPDVLRHILCLNHKKLPCSTKYLYNAPTKMNYLWHMHFFTFFHIIPFVSQTPLQYMSKTGRPISSTITFIHSVCLIDGWLLGFWHFAGENLSYHTLQSVKLQVTVATQQLQTCESMTPWAIPLLNI